MLQGRAHTAGAFRTGDVVRRGGRRSAIEESGRRPQEGAVGRGAGRRPRPSSRAEAQGPEPGENICPGRPETPAEPRVVLDVPLRRGRGLESPGLAPPRPARPPAGASQPWARAWGGAGVR